MTYLIAFIILGVAIAGAIKFALHIHKEIQAGKRRQERDDAIHKAKLQQECVHTWGPWSQPHQGKQDRSCLTCNLHAVRVA